MRKKRAVIVINTYKEEAQLIANDVKSFLEKESWNADFLEFSGPCSKSNFEGYDLAVTLGGDGTVLFAARGPVATADLRYLGGFALTPQVAPVSPKTVKGTRS